MIRPTPLLAALIVALEPVASAGGFDSRHACVAAAGDLDGDGVADVLVANRAPGVRECVWAVSVKRGAVLYRIEGRVPGDSFGCALADLGDVDQDSVSEFAVGTLGFHMQPYPERGGTWDERVVGRSGVRIVSGKTGSTLREITAPQVGERLGVSVAPAGDLDGDGACDLLAGNTQVLTASERSTCPDVKSVIDVFSSKTGERLRRIEAPEGSAAGFGFSVALVGDVDGDGKPDWAGAAPFAGNGRMHLISSSTGNLLHTFPAYGAPEFGSSLAALPARDGKPGYLAVKAERHVHVLDLAEKKPLYVVPSRMVSIIDDFGASMSLVFDPKHGALPVLAAGANESCPPGFFDSGYADLCGADGKVIRALMPEDRSQGVDATAIGDFDGDQRPDYACVSVNEMRLVLIGSDEKTARREIKLLEPAPSSK